MTNHTELDAYIQTLLDAGLTYNAVFVPQSASRNSGEKNPSLNWRIALVNAKGARLDTDYMQGIGHVPGYASKYWRRRTLYEQTLALTQEQAAQTGKYPVSADGKPATVKSVHLTSWPRLHSLPVPLLRDILYGLLMDAQGVNDANGFEDWASNYGYDTDSRKVEATYEACKRTASDLNRLLGRANIDRLAELFQDY